MKKILFLLYFCIPFFAISQSNTLNVGIIAGMTPYLLEDAAIGTGYEIQYQRETDLKLSFSLSVGQINNVHTSKKFTIAHQNGEKIRDYNYEYKEIEKSFFVDLNVFYPIYQKSRYTFEVGFGGTLFANEYDYVNNIELENTQAIFTRANSKTNIIMANLAFDNQFNLTDNVVINLKGIIRRQFPEGNVLHRSVNDSVTSSLVLTGNYNLVLGIGYRF